MMQSTTIFLRKLSCLMLVWWRKMKPNKSFGKWMRNPYVTSNKQVQFTLLTTHCISDIYPPLSEVYPAETNTGRYHTICLYQSSIKLLLCRWCISFKGLNYVFKSKSSLIVKNLFLVCFIYSILTILDCFLYIFGKNRASYSFLTFSSWNRKQSYLLIQKGADLPHTKPKQQVY